MFISSFATLTCAIYYSQILGAIFGALIYTSLIPTLHIGAGAGSPGCFAPGNGSKSQDPICIVVSNAKRFRPPPPVLDEQ